MSLAYQHCCVKSLKNWKSFYRTNSRQIAVIDRISDLVSNPVLTTTVTMYSIAEDCKVNVRTVFRAIDRAVEIGLIKRHKDCKNIGTHRVPFFYNRTYLEWLGDVEQTKDEIIVNYIIKNKPIPSFCNNFFLKTSTHFVPQIEPPKRNNIPIHTPTPKESPLQANYNIDVPPRENWDYIEKFPMMQEVLKRGYKAEEVLKIYPRSIIDRFYFITWYKFRDVPNANIINMDLEISRYLEVLQGK